MSELLSENEIDALMNGVANSARPAGSELNEVDYSPYDLTSGMSRIQGWTQYVEIVDDHIQAGLSTRFLGILHKSVEIRRDRIEIRKYQDFATTLKLPTAISCFTLSGVVGVSAIILESSLVSALVNVFFGGGSRATPIEGREFSHTEKRLINMIVGTVAEVIREGFTEFADHEITIVDTETNPAHFSAYADTDMLMIRPFRVEFSGMGGLIHLVMPGSVVDAIFRQKRSRLNELGISARVALASQARDFEMTVTGELRGAQLSLREVLELGKGDVIPIAAPDQVDVKVNNVPKFKARMGEVNGRIGLEILPSSHARGGFRK
ncbi:MAG: FliM/FliN family flagellar motor switch protein [Gammaproteobacteria bacterium]|nr:FliM/FliN family flagellar motor switch protein [Pseudomonadales bacterium]MCP5349047.1 FliM/FliN family flagellar motor switch protein [Pseudomonadales bacterium]